MSRIGIFHIIFSGVRRSVYSQRCNFNAIAAGRMRTVSKIFVQLGFFDSQPASVNLNNELPGRTAGPYVRTFVRKVSSVCLGGDISLSVALEVCRARAIQGYCVERLSLAT